MFLQENDIPITYTLFPRIQRHAVIYETAYFQKWTSGFGYIGMPDIIRGLRHVVLYETFKETMPNLDHDCKNIVSKKWSKEFLIF